MRKNPTQQFNKKEARQQRKEQERRHRQRASSMRMFRNYAIVVVIIVIIGYGVYLLAQGEAPQGEDFSRAVPIMEAGHLSVGSQLLEYNSNPPTSGPHYDQTARSGFRNDIIADQHIIHNLEHGDVWIAYHPRIPDEVKQELTQFAAAKVIITPREVNDSDIALAAWGRLDTFNVENNTVPIERVKDFIKRHTNKGPEQVPGASGGI